MSKKTLNIVEFVREDVDDYDTWRDSTDFDYHRDESAAIDYIGECIDRDTLNEKLRNGDIDDFEISDWDKLSEIANISEESGKFDAIKNNIETYIQKGIAENHN